MGCQPNLYSLPLAELPFKTKQLLSYLLNSTKIIPSDGPDKLPRDWRGLAHLINIPNFVSSSLHQYHDKTAKILEIWIQEKTVIATVGKLLEFMQILDRYDVHDDILDNLQWYIHGQELDVNQPYQLAVKPKNNLLAPVDEVYDLITYDDTPDKLQSYDAFVLYADEDSDFVDELFQKLGDDFQFCTKEKLLGGHATQYTPVAQLISQRCRFIILVYSPEFVTSPANSFYTDYAQAVAIETQNNSNKLKIIPVMYRDCQLPVNLQYYTKIYYKTEGRAMYDFWQRLRQSLLQSTPSPLPSNRLTSSPSVQSSLKIEELSNGMIDDSQYFLQPTRANISASVSMSKLDSLKGSEQADEKSLSGYSHLSVNLDIPKKRNGPIKWITKKIFRNKNKRDLKFESQLVDKPLVAGMSTTE